jgi:ABC-type nitrate/sulfonate/bicarbonate transport system substrate-binding protein
MRSILTLLIVCTLAGCAAETGDPNHIRFVLDWKAQMEHAGFYVAQARGFYAEEGLTVEILEGAGAPTTAQLVGNGTYRLGLASGSATVIARDRGIPIVSLAVINQHSPVVIYSLEGAGIRKPEDLVGKRVGANVGGTKHREFQALLKKRNIAETDIQFMGMTEASPAPLLAGKVDAMLGYTEDQPVTVELRNQAVTRIALADYGIDLYSTNIIGNESFVANSPDIVQRFVRASLRGWVEALKDPEAAADAYEAKRPESDADFNRANFKSLIPILQSPDVDRMGFGAQTRDRWEHTRDVLHDLGMIESDVSLDKLFTNQFLQKEE